MKLIEPDTTTHDSIPAKTGENDGDGMKLIEAEKAKDVIHEYFKSLMVKDASGADVYKLAVGIVSCLEHDANLMKAIDELPPAQPEHKTGHWIPVTNGRGGHQCDRCGSYAPSYQSGAEWLSKFCPECNADMRGEQDDKCRQV